MLSRKPDIEAEHLVRDDDLAWLKVTSDTPVACQIDGDYVGHARNDGVHVRSRNALGVVAPPAPAKAAADLQR